ncbi:MAG: DNA polymerase III subunit gamma/tau [Planctomycetaceae bacterium]|jgi:DNA polymerase III subunit gamma/tau|nr:DNA polymerase III subunit gamma/tau [Planctomycetaceae bacterium]
MAGPIENQDELNHDTTSQDAYVVVARRYRPQSFDELIGQSHVQKALGNAIETGRVGHAYLFAGPRGVGKTTTARIFAKALNCISGPTIQPCQTCDVCRMISSGEDMDVIEIDGASNNGIDEIRTLRKNVSVMASRCRYKVYIIDEVHMLSRQAFNGLLKTLEEPPEHVKFMFCTTDPDKIPITVLSRCQRFDLLPVTHDKIQDRLQFIVESEGRSADASALDLVARRAHGSMRDSQSLLEQLMAFCTGHITVDDVHRLLGTTASGRVLDLLEHLSRRDAAGAIGCLHELWKSGSEPEQVAQQLMGVYRDVLTVAVGAGREIMEFTQVDEFARVQQLAESIGKYTALAALEILQEMFRKMRNSVQVRLLIEMTVIRIATLEELDEIQNWLNLLQSPELMKLAEKSPMVAVGNESNITSSVAEKKNDIMPIDLARVASETTTTPATEPLNVSQEPTEAATFTSVDEVTVTVPVGDSLTISQTKPPVDLVVITSENIAAVWSQLCVEFDDLFANILQSADVVSLSEPNHISVMFPHDFSFQKETCERPERRQKVVEAINALTGMQFKVSFGLLKKTAVDVSPVAVVKTARERNIEAEDNPFVRRAVEVFEAEISHIDHPH